MLVTPVAPLTNDDVEASTMAIPKPIRTDLTAEYLRSILDYCPEVGVLIWRERTDIAAGRARTSWNARYAGMVAGTPMDERGYSRIKLNGRLYLAHRLAWLHHYGEWPAAEIDHINGDPADNRIANLRLATPSQNHGNRGKNRNNTSGFKGVYWHRQCQRWYAQIMANGSVDHLGFFDTAEEAHAAYAAAAKKHFGEFARTE